MIGANIQECIPVVGGFIISLTTELTTRDSTSSNMRPMKKKSILYVDCECQEDSQENTVIQQSEVTQSCDLYGDFAGLIHVHIVNQENHCLMVIQDFC